MKTGRMAFFFLFIVVSVVFNVFAQSPEALAVKEEFQKMDINNDKAVSLNEFQQYQSQTFNGLDKNSDGTINKNELQGDKAKMFQGADIDNNSEISQKEACAKFNDYFNSMDKNKDNKVSEEEFKEYWPVVINY